MEKINKDLPEVNDIKTEIKEEKNSYLLRKTKWRSYSLSKEILDTNCKKQILLYMKKKRKELVKDEKMKKLAEIDNTSNIQLRKKGKKHFMFLI